MYNDERLYVFCCYLFWLVFIAFPSFGWFSKFVSDKKLLSSLLLVGFWFVLYFANSVAEK